MNYLIGDIGNTNIKFSILNDKFKIIQIKNIETKKIYSNKYKNFFLNQLCKKQISNKILFSSVVPKAFKLIKSFFLKKKYKIYEIKDLNINKILKININKYDQLGSDRISNALGALNYKNCIIIDFGTATTFDIVKNYMYEGGVISPGVKLSILNLNRSTALLPAINLRSNQKIFGKNTKEALNAGFIWGYEGLINNIIKKICIKTKINFKIILTGGFSKLFKKHIYKKSIIDKNITIKGIAQAYKKLL